MLQNRDANFDTCAGSLVPSRKGLAQWSSFMASSRTQMGSRHSKQPEHSPTVAATIIANATAASAASKAAKTGNGCFSGQADPVALPTTAEDLLEQCKCPISLELMRRPVLPSSGICLAFSKCHKAVIVQSLAASNQVCFVCAGQAFDEINLKRWSLSGNTKCPVSGQELRMHKEKVQYTKHHLLRNIIRQQAAKAKVQVISNNT